MRLIGQRLAFGSSATSSTKRRSRQSSRRATLRAGSRSSSASHENATVLVVDDDPSILSALARLLRSAGFKVRTFDRPSALLASETPKTNTCMLIDLHLPEMNGVELCKALAESGRDLPAIMITGRTDAVTKQLLEQADSVATLSKPVDEQVLLDAIARALELSKG